jgi:hypothetical protein
LRGGRIDAVELFRLGGHRTELQDLLNVFVGEHPAPPDLVSWKQTGPEFIFDPAWVAAEIDSDFGDFIDPGVIGFR